MNVEEKSQNYYARPCHARQISGAFPWHGRDTARDDKIKRWSVAVSENIQNAFASPFFYNILPGELTLIASFIRAANRDKNTTLF